MTDIENIKTTFPDSFGIKENLRNGTVNNPEFLDLTLKSYEMLALLKDQKLSIEESLRANQNVDIYDHQILAARKIKNELEGTAMLADEVGLGKTIEAGIIIKEFLTTGLANKVLILAPPSLLLQWQGEMASKFDLDFVNQQGDSRFTGVADHDLLIMSHSSAVYPKYSEINDVYWDLVIVDEAHSMKNSQTLKHNLVKKLSKRHLLLLTATPLQNNMEEIYNLVEMLRPGHLGTWNEFQTKYTTDKNARRINPKSKDKLQKLLASCIIRTTRKEVRRYIPFTDRIPHNVILEPTHNEKKLYNVITKIIRRMYFDSYNSPVLMTYQRLICSSTNSTKMALYKMKMNGVITEERYNALVHVANSITVDSKLAHMLKILDRDSSKFLIFTEFYATQDYIADALRGRGYSVVLFNGKLSYDERNDAKKQFQNDAQIMISTSAGGEGQNFQFCHNVINYDLPWNPMRVEQRIGRVHRIGQEHDVQIYSYALEDTIEAYILELLYEKIKLFNMALGEMDLLFEDLEEGGAVQKLFKDHMNAKNENEIKNKFSALGDDWKRRKKNINETINDFNNDVFANFNLSVLEENHDAQV